MKSFLISCLLGYLVTKLGLSRGWTFGQIVASVIGASVVLAFAAGASACSVRGTDDCALAADRKAMAEYCTERELSTCAGMYTEHVTGEAAAYRVRCETRSDVESGL